MNINNLERELMNDQLESDELQYSDDDYDWRNDVVYDDFDNDY